MQRLIPPAAGGNPATITVNGRSYSCALGAEIDVPDCDAFVMLANGWVAAAAGGAGATAQRPANPTNGQQFYDETLGKTIVYDGQQWCDIDTGGAV